jgi:selenocysteine-specific elongation factor
MPPALTRRGAARRRAAELATVTGQRDAAAEVGRRGAIRREDLVAAGVSVDSAVSGSVSAGDWLVADTVWQGWADHLSAVMDEWAGMHPEHPGMPRRSAATAAGLPDPHLIDHVAGAADLVVDADGVHRRGVSALLPEDVGRRLDEIVTRLRRDPFAAPEAGELEAAGLTARYLAVATHAGRLERIATGIYLLPGAIDEAVRRLSALAQPFTMSAARTALGTTRRVAVPLLELLDARQHTYRVDAQRRAVKTV